MTKLSNKANSFNAQISQILSIVKPVTVLSSAANSTVWNVEATFRSSNLSYYLRALAENMILSVVSTYQSFTASKKLNTFLKPVQLEHFSMTHFGFEPEACFTCIKFDNTKDMKEVEIVSNTGCKIEA